MDKAITEHQFQDAFIKLARSYGADAYSIVGGIYQSGRPDIDITSTFGNSTKIELKVYRGTYLPSRSDIVALLHGPQRNVIINQLWARNANCLLIAHIMHDPKMCAIVNREDIRFDLWQIVCKNISQCQYGTRPYGTTK